MPPPVNEPIKSYAPGSPERASLKARLKTMAAETVDMPLIIGGKEICTNDMAASVMPHDHKHVLGTYHKATEKDVVAAIEAAAAARAEWSSWAFEDRAAVMLKAAELLTTTWRDTINAATMLGQSKTAFQAEIDAAAELVDFWRFNAHYAQELLAEQPISDHTMWNQPYAPRRLRLRRVAVQLHADRQQPRHRAGADGHTVIWKPASSAMLSAHFDEATRWPACRPASSTSSRRTPR